MRIYIPGIGFFLSICFILLSVGCASNNHKNSSSNRNLIGTWKADIGFATWIITRNSNNTFEERRIQIYDYSKPSVSFLATGMWYLEGQKYVKIYKSASAEVWQSAIDKKLISGIVKISNNQFQYKPDDGPLVIERRLNSGEAGNFEAIPLKLTQL